jgi:DNA-binding Lrp family transcriptional regulator
VTNIEKRARVRAELERDAGRPDRAVAWACGVSVPLVRWVRRELGLALPTREDKRRRVAEELRRDGRRSDRALAALCGCSPGTVASVRKGLGLEGQERRGSDGRVRRLPSRSTPQD